MKKVRVLSVLVIVVLLMSLSGAYAQTRMPGVSVGDTFKYTYTFDMTTSDGQSESLLPEFLQALIDQTKNIDSTQITITDVTGSSVTLQNVMIFKNGTQETNTGTIDVSTGQGNLTLSLIAANLTSNDPIYLDNSDSIINETITQTNALGTRQVNHQNIIMNYFVTQEELSGFSITGPLNQTNSQNTYWDKLTGMLVEMSYVMQTKSDQVNADITVDVVMVDSSVQPIPELPTAAILLVFLVASTFAILKLGRIAPKKNTPI
jgi:hypothetical protein